MIDLHLILVAPGLFHIGIVIVMCLLFVTFFIASEAAPTDKRRKLDGNDSSEKESSSDDTTTNGEPCTWPGATAPYDIAACVTEDPESLMNFCHAVILRMSSRQRDLISNYAKKNQRWKPSLSSSCSGCLVGEDAFEACFVYRVPLT